MNMKKGIFLLFALLPLLLHSQNVTIYEAEIALLADSVSVRADNTASNDKYLYIGKPSSVKWIVDNVLPGWYKLSLRYRSVDGDKAQVFDVNGKKLGVGFSRCNYWSDAFFSTYLQKGRNEITLIADYGNMDIDYLRIPEDTLIPLPSISPINGVFYKEYPTSMSVFVDAKGQKLKKISCSNQQIDFKISNFDYVEGSYLAEISKESILNIPIGNNILDLEFSNGSKVQYKLQVKASVNTSELTIIMFNVEHGNSVLVLLPNGKRLLIDSGKEQYAKSVVMPFLDNNKIDTIDYYIITHYHDDHAGAKDEIIKKYHVQQFLDYKSFKTGDTLKLGKAIITILNTFADGENENDRSMSFLLNYNGFTYSHGSDNYAITQDRILKNFINILPAQVFYANHHFHGSVNPNFIIKTNPALVVVSAEQGVYARGAFTNYYKEQTEKVLYANHARLQQTLLTLESGTVVVRINSANDWYYETYRNDKDIYLPKKTK